MKQVTIYTNGKSLFTMENYGKTAGVSHVNGITIHSTVSMLKKRAMHSNGSLHYVHGVGDAKAISGVSMHRGMIAGSFVVR